MATQSSILAQKIPWTEEPGRLQSMGSQELDMTERLHFPFLWVISPMIIYSPDWLFSRLKVKVKVKSLSRVPLFATLWTSAYQAPLSMGFSRQEYWSGLPFPPPGDIPDPGMELASLMSPALAVGFFTASATRNSNQQRKA